MTASGLSEPNLPPVRLELGRAILEGEPWTRSDSNIDIAEGLTQGVRLMTIWRPERLHVVKAMEPRAATLLNAADEWLRVHRDHPWLKPVPRGRGKQVRIRYREGVQLGGLVMIGGYRYNAASRPQGATVITTTALDSESPPWQDELRAFGTAQEAVEVPESARILEVATLADWTNLVESYPTVQARHEVHLTDQVMLPAPLYAPDWKLVSESWDAVHFDWSGISAIAFVEAPVNDGYAVWQDETGLEHTVWLNWREGADGEVQLD